MTKIVKAIVEDPPRELLLISTWERENNGKKTKCCDILKPYKMVHTIDEYGRMGVQYYTEDEWHGVPEEEIYYPRETYVPGYLSYRTYVHYINAYIENGSLRGFARYIYNPFDDKDLDNASLALRSAILQWDGRKPFEHKGLNTVQTKREEEDGTFWYVDSISV